MDAVQARIFQERVGVSPLMVRRILSSGEYRVDGTRKTKPSMGNRRQRRRAANAVAKQSRKRNR